MFSTSKVCYLRAWYNCQVIASHYQARASSLSHIKEYSCILPLETAFLCKKLLFTDREIDRSSISKMIKSIPVASERSLTNSTKSLPQTNLYSKRIFCNSQDTQYTTERIPKIILEDFKLLNNTLLYNNKAQNKNYAKLP